METVLAVLIFALVVAGMSVGVIFMKRPIAGSCGGLNNLNGGEGNCEICGVAAAGKCQKKAHKAG